MNSDRHRSLLDFIKRVVDVPLGYSKEDLAEFRSVAQGEFSALVPLIDAYLGFMEKSETDAVLARTNSKSTKLVRRTRADEEMHLFDLLRERKLFPSNAELSDFASRVLPGMKPYRFDKMSRGDIAGRVIEHLETLDPKTRKDLEASMREAMSLGEKTVDRKSFLSKWEKIIKGIEL